MSLRYYENHLQDIDAKPRLSTETVPELRISHPSEENSPELPPSYMSPHLTAKFVSPSVPERPDERMEQHIIDVMEVGEHHDEERGTKRVRFKDHELGPVRRARMVSLVEQIATSDEDGKVPNDKDLIELQMIAIDQLQQERDKLEVENVRLRALNREQTASRVSVLKEIVRHRGVELKAHGEFLIRMAHRGLSECQEG